jgi:hypothetical protein
MQQPAITGNDVHATVVFIYIHVYMYVCSLCVICITKYMPHRCAALQIQQHVQQRQRVLPATQAQAQPVALLYHAPLLRVRQGTRTKTGNEDERRD